MDKIIVFIIVLIAVINAISRAMKEKRAKERAPEAPPRKRPPNPLEQFLKSLQPESEEMPVLQEEVAMPLPPTKPAPEKAPVKAVPRKVKRDEREPVSFYEEAAPPFAGIDVETAEHGVIMAEILGPPLAKRRAGPHARRLF
jgi:hypothetical protein